MTAARLKAIARERIYVAALGDGFSVRGQLGGPDAVPGSPGYAIFGVGTEAQCKARRVIVLGVVDQIVDAAFQERQAVHGGFGMTNKLYPCGCTASPNAPDYCPEHGQPISKDADHYAYNLDQFRMENDRLRQENVVLRKWMVDARKALDAARETARDSDNQRHWL